MRNTKPAKEVDWLFAFHSATVALLGPQASPWAQLLALGRQQRRDLNASVLSCLAGKTSDADATASLSAASRAWSKVDQGYVRFLLCFTRRVLTAGVEMKPGLVAHELERRLFVLLSDIEESAPFLVALLNEAVPDARRANDLSAGFAYDADAGWSQALRQASGDPRQRLTLLHAAMEISPPDARLRALMEYGFDVAP